MFPLMLLFLAIFLVESTTSFFLLALVVIGWIRSGICFRKRAAIRLIAEVLLGFVGGILLTAISPGSAIAWALGVWMFFLVQTLYFIPFEDTDNLEEETVEMDPFEQTSRQAETILSKAFFQ